MGTILYQMAILPAFITEMGTKLPELKGGIRSAVVGLSSLSGSLGTFTLSLMGSSADLLGPFRLITIGSIVYFILGSTRLFVEYPRKSSIVRDGVWFYL